MFYVQVKHQFPLDHKSQETMSMFNTWMDDC